MNPAPEEWREQLLPGEKLPSSQASSSSKGLAAPLHEDPRELVPETMQRAYYRSQEEPPLEVPSRISVPSDILPKDKPADVAPEVWAQVAEGRSQPAPEPLPPTQAAFQRPGDPVVPPPISVPPAVNVQPAPPARASLEGPPLRGAAGGVSEATPESLETAIPIVKLHAKDPPESSLTPAPEPTESPVAESSLTPDAGDLASAPDEPTGSPKPASSPNQAEKATPAPKATPKAAAKAHKPASPVPSGDSAMLNLYTPAPNVPPTTNKPPGQLDPGAAPAPPGENLTVQVTILPRNVEAHVMVTSDENGYEDKGSGSFALPDVVPGTYSVTVQAPGYKTTKQKQTLSDAHHNILVVLEPAQGGSSKAPSSAVTTSLPNPGPPPNRPSYPPPTKYTAPSPPPGRYEIPSPTL